MTKPNQRDGSALTVWGVFALLGLSFASYDLIIWFLGNAHTLLNLQVHDGYRFDEAYMYLAGTGKTILFDPYLQEHASNLTLRPILPVGLFSLLYWVCGKNLDLTIFFGHVIPPLISCYLIYRIAYQLTTKRNLAILAVLLAVGHFALSVLMLSAKWTDQAAGGVAGPDLYLLKQIFVNAVGNITAPNQFGRLFSPALTLPFLLLPISMILAQTKPALRSFLIALNLYVYPHHVIVLSVMECVAWLKTRQLPQFRFFIVGVMASVPYAIQLWMVNVGGSYADIYSRVGQTSELSSMWFFIPLFGITSAVIWYQNKTWTTSLILSLGCFMAVVLVHLLDSVLKFPQVHLVGLRIFVFLAPLAFVSTLSHCQLPRIKYANTALLGLILFGYAQSGWIHRNAYPSFENPGWKDFITELSAIPSGSVVMTDVQQEIAYISAKTDAYSYLAYGIVSSATNQELIKRLTIVSEIYGWKPDQLYGGDWDGLLSTHHWIFHHGANSKEIQNKEIESVASGLSGLDHCALLSIYRVDYIRFRGQPPANVENCTTAYSPHFLKVIHP